ncbi:MAG TPA: choice-of-anchor P family protein [Nocardioidaceae bacterium]|nr:choice-of-anchor P family protein [Nocardioidaceae bacterium]
MKTTSLLARAAAATATLAAGIAGSMVVAPPAQAALVETDYGYFTFAFGTSAKAEMLGLNSGKTAFSIIGCTRLAGVKKTRNVAAVDAPANVPTLGVGAVTSTSETFKSNGNNGSKSTNKVAGIRLGVPDGLNLEIRGLETTAAAWADSKGKYHTQATFKLADIKANTGIPAVDDLLNQVNVGIGDLINVILAQPNDNLIIPGVGAIRLGRKISRIRSNMAISNAIALRVVLFGANALEGGGDDIKVTIGRSHARVYGEVTSSIMRGVGFPAEVNVIDGLAKVGAVGRQPLPCVGTYGKVLENPVVGLNLANLGVVDVGAAVGRAYGIQNPNGSAVGWTEGRIATVALGQGETRLVIKGVVGHAEIRMSRTGRLFKSIAGTKFASITVGGDEQDISLGDDITIPGVAQIKFGVVDRSGRQIRVIAVQIVLLEGVAESTGLATVNLGVARVRMNRL